MYFVYFVSFAKEVCPVLTNVALVTESGVVLRHWESKEKIHFKEWRDKQTTKASFEKQVYQSFRFFPEDMGSLFGNNKRVMIIMTNTRTLPSMHLFIVCIVSGNKHVRQHC